MAEDSDLERTEQPSSRRLEQAREKGQVPRSRELTALLELVSVSIVLWVGGGWLLKRLTGLFEQGLAMDRATTFDGDRLLTHFGTLGGEAVLTALPLVVAGGSAAFLAPMFLNAWIFSPQALAPDISRLDPIKGAKRIISINGLVELVKALAKAALIGTVVFWVILQERDTLFSMLALPVEQGVSTAARMFGLAMLAFVFGMLVIAAFDVPFQIWNHHKNLRMTREEVKREMREQEGDPYLKARIRSQQRELARRRMMESVPTADVVVTNPTHFSVALAYQPGSRAPKVVAKGRGEIALKIREIAREAGVPLLEAPPLARALYTHTELDEEIPFTLYTAVAEVLAYVYQLAEAVRLGGPEPLPPGELPVPAELDPGVVA